jgi:hypothetical protein
MKKSPLTWMATAVGPTPIKSQGPGAAGFHDSLASPSSQAPVFTHDNALWRNGLQGEFLSSKQWIKSSRCFTGISQ